MYFPSLMGMPPETVAFEPVDPREAAFQKLFDVHSLKVLASHGQDTFENLYKGSRGDPEYAADYKAALESEKFQATLKQYERMDVGEFMST